MRASAGLRAGTLALVLLVLAGCGHPPVATPVTARLPVAAPAAPATGADVQVPPIPPPPAPPPALVDPNLSLLAPPVPLPLTFKAPSVGIVLPVLATGKTSAGAMDAPEGPASSPLWHDAFWYRGGSEPGQQGTTTIGGHVDDVLGRPAAFWTIRDLKVGDVVEIDDSRPDGTGVSLYRITDANIYSYAEADSPPMLQKLYGDAAYDGDPTERNLATDAVSRISIITCTGVFHRGSPMGYDHRFIAFGILIPNGPAPVATPALPDTLPGLHAL